MIEKKTPLGVLRIRRVRGGVELYAQSQVFADYWRDLGTEPYKVGEELYYSFPGNLDRVSFAPERMLLTEYQTDLSIFALAGIGTGVTRVVPQVISREQLLLFATKAKSGLAAFYREYVRDVEVTVEVTSLEDPQ